MSEKKLKELEEMYRKTSRPKIVIDEFDEITRLGCIFDATPQGENALSTATALAKVLSAPLKVFTADDFNKKLQNTSEEIRNKEKEMIEQIDALSQEKEIATEIEPLVSGIMKRILKSIEEELVEEEKLSNLMVEKIIEGNFDIFIAGSPMLRTRQEKGYFGYYLRKLLKQHAIQSNFLLVPNELKGESDLMLGLVSYRQIPRSVETIIKRGVALSSWKKKMKLVGIIEDNTIRTIARSETDDDETLSNVSEVRERTRSKFFDTLDSFTIDEKYDIPLSKELEIGDITAVVKLILDKYEPGLVLVSTESKIDENLDPGAETLTRIALTEGYPVLLVWD